MTLQIIGVVSAIFVAVFTFRVYNSTDQGTGQSRRQSIIEAWVNIAIGFSVNFVANLFILPMIGASFTLSENFWMGWIYTAVSVIRQYAIRRWFNNSIHRAAVRLAGRGT